MIHSEHVCQGFGLEVVTPVTFDCVVWPVGYIVSLYNIGVGALQIGISVGLPVGNLLLVDVESSACESYL